MASHLLAANQNDDDMKADNWDDGMYDCDATVATPGPKDGKEAASGMKVTQPQPENSKAAWADWMRPKPDSSDDKSKAHDMVSKAHEGGALNAAKALKKQDAANRAKEAAVKMLMAAAKQCASTRVNAKELQDKQKREDRKNKRAASTVQDGASSVHRPGNGATPSPKTARQLFRSPPTGEAPEWLSPAAGSSNEAPPKKRRATKSKKAPEVEEKESVEEDEESEEEDEESEEEDEESEEESQEDEESEEEESPPKKKVEKPVRGSKVRSHPGPGKPTRKPGYGAKNTFAGNRPPAGADALELFNLKKTAFQLCQQETDEKNPSLKKLNHKVNDQFKYWKHMQEAIAKLKEDNEDATQADYRKCFGEAAKSWRAKCVQTLKENTELEVW